MKEEWVKKYFRAFDRNDSGTIDFQEYVMGFAGMARVS
jgi:Ca2+-binding EF-hand superfamily protein